MDNKTKKSIDKPIFLPSPNLPDSTECCMDLQKKQKELKELKENSRELNIRLQHLDLIMQKQTYLLKIAEKELNKCARERRGTRTIEKLYREMDEGLPTVPEDSNDQDEKQVVVDASSDVVGGGNSILKNKKNKSKRKKSKSIRNKSKRNISRKRSKKSRKSKKSKRSRK